jgi:transcriptional regulator with XRE-family HTH domain
VIPVMPIALIDAIGLWLLCSFKDRGEAIAGRSRALRSRRSEVRQPALTIVLRRNRDGVLRKVAGLSDRTIAAATGAKPSTVRGWLSGRSEPTGAHAERLIELAEMIKRLALVVKPESIAVWLMRPILALDDEKPVELIARGEYRRVAKLISEIEYPGVS